MCCIFLYNILPANMFLPDKITLKVESNEVEILGFCRSNFIKKLNLIALGG
jgi:hypothetical protein